MLRHDSPAPSTDAAPLAEGSKAASLKEQVLQALRREIVSGAIGQGVRLVEQELCARMSVSRTPLREALRQLEAEGLVVVEPHKGARVSRKSQDELWEHYRVYATLQGLAAELAAPRLSDADRQSLLVLQAELEAPGARADVASWIAKNGDFHRLFLERSKSSTVSELLSRQAQYLSRFWPLGVHAPGVLEATFEQHRKIVELSVAERAAELRDAVEEHFLGTGRLLLDHAGTVYAL